MVKKGRIVRFLACLFVMANAIMALAQLHKGG